jgi:ribonuclease VapC
MVLTSIRHGRGYDVLDKILAAPRMDTISFDRPIFALAAAAFDRYGRGRHRARLNFGDCMAYAVAKAHDVPLLFKGTDFAHTDLRPALP